MYLLPRICNNYNTTNRGEVSYKINKGHADAVETKQMNITRVLSKKQSLATQTKSRRKKNLTIQTII